MNDCTSLFVSHNDGFTTPPPSYNCSDNPFICMPQAPPHRFGEGIDVGVGVVSYKELISRRTFLDLDDGDHDRLFAPVLLFQSSSSPTNDNNSDTTNIKKLKTTMGDTSFRKNNDTSCSMTLKVKRDGVITTEIETGRGRTAVVAVAFECDDDALVGTTLNGSSSNNNNNNNNNTPLLLSELSLRSEGEGGGGGGVSNSKEEETLSSTKTQKNNDGVVASGKDVPRRDSATARCA